MNDTLALMLNARHLRATNEGLSVSMLDADAHRVFDALYDITHEPAPSGKTLATAVKNKYSGKGREGFIQ